MQLHIDQKATHRWSETISWANRCKLAHLAVLIARSMLKPLRAQAKWTLAYTTADPGGAWQHNLKITQTGQDGRGELLPAEWL